MTRTRAAIVGTGYSSPIVRLSDKPLGCLALEAAEAAARDAGISVSEIDGLSVYPNPSRLGPSFNDGVDFVSATYMARVLRLPDLRWSAQLHPGSFVGSVIEAAYAVSAGACKYALAWRAMHNPEGKFGRYEETEAFGIDQFLAPYGLTNAVMQYALQYSRYLTKYGATREHLASYVVSNRENASLTPESVFFGKPITREDYLSARLIAEPYCLLDCDMPVDVCSAVIVAHRDVALDLSDPVHIVGSATLGLRPSVNIVTTLEDFEVAAAQLGRVLWRDAHIKPEDVDLLNTYDGFSGFIYYFLEAYGFCGRGEAFEFIQDGRIARGGRLPVNPNGGSLGMGRTHGGAQVIEGVRQLQGRCADRQVPDVKVAVVASGGNPGNSHGVLALSTDPL